MKPHFKRVGLIGKSADKNVSVTLRALAAYLEKLKVKVLLDEGIAGLFPENSYPAVDRSTLASKCSLAIVVGGDGTLLKEMQETRSTMNSMMITAMQMADQVLDDTEHGGFVMAGQTNLMEFEELCNIDKLRKLFDAFSQKRDMLHLLDQCVNAEGIQIFIGEESGYQMLDECSMVTAPYSVEGEALGVLGVIGPTRMAYDRVIPIVDATARLLGAALNQKD